ncbi:MAG: hypothetical protein H7834_01050 [Magnetococcus sp. YQC-9]
MYNRLFACRMQDHVIFSCKPLSDPPRKERSSQRVYLFTEVNRTDLRAWKFLFIDKKKRGSGRFLSQGFAFDFGALLKEASFAFFAKNAPRAAFAGVVFCFLETTPASCTRALRKTTHPKMGAI